MLVHGFEQPSCLADLRHIEPKPSPPLQDAVEPAGDRMMVVGIVTRPPIRRSVKVSGPAIAVLGKHQGCELVSQRSQHVEGRVDGVGSRAEQPTVEQQLGPYVSDRPSRTS